MEGIDAVPEASGRGPRLRVALDILSWALAAAGLALWLRAGPNARFWPWLGLALPAIRWTLNAGYRRRLRSWAVAARREAEEWGRGGPAIPWRAAVAFVAAPFFLFEASNGGTLGTFDTRPVTPTAVSLIRDGDVDLREFEGLRPPLLRTRDGVRCYSFQEVGGRIVSAYPSGMVPFAVLAALPARAMGADLDSAATLRYLEKATASAVAALALGLAFLVASRLATARGGAATALLLATGSGFLTNVGLGLWQHGGVVVWLLAALLVECARDGRPGRRATAFQGFALAQMVACRPTAGLLAALFGLWALARSPRRGLWLGACGAMGLAPWLGFHAWIYHDLRGPATIHAHAGTAGYWSFFAAWPMLGVLFSPARGLFVYQPWAVLAVVGVAAWARHGFRRPSGDVGPPGWRAFCLAAVVLHVVLIAAWWEWAGGYCYGSRLMIDALPPLALLAAPVAAALARTRRGVATLAALALLGFAIHVPCIAFEAHRWNLERPRDLWSWSHAPFFYRATGPGAPPEFALGDQNVQR
ncbi:MAG: hypothetical protein BGO49_30660 [Planctomycetales bacterium 71-10]|nr:MAG: hypothetical protein BGO49_30660 [Planctomycetales bacterium 71-10]